MSSLKKRNEIKMEVMGQMEAQDERIMKLLLDLKKKSFCHFMEVTEFLCLSRWKKMKVRTKVKKTKKIKIKIENLVPEFQTSHLTT